MAVDKLVGDPAQVLSKNLLCSVAQLDYYLSEPQCLKDPVIQEKILYTTDSTCEYERIFDDCISGLKIKDSAVKIDPKKMPEKYIVALKKNPFFFLANLKVAIFRTLNIFISAVVFADTPIKTSPLLELGADNLGELVRVSGMVRRISGTNVAVTRSLYVCKACLVNYASYRNRFDSFSPDRCHRCNTNKNSIQIENERTYRHWQDLYIQDVEGSENFNRQLRLIIVDKSVFDNYMPGDVVDGVGYIAAIKKDTAQVQYFVEVLSLNHKTEKHKINRRTSAVYEAFATQNQNYWQLLKQKMFHGIYGLDSCKDALLLQCFSKYVPEARESIHILICGNPGCGKSALMKKVASQVGGSYVTGMGATAAGLTATAYKQALGTWMLDGGLLVTRPNLPVFLDQLDKLDKSSQNALLEAMEQQTVSIAKAGLNLSLSARCKIVGACNPKVSNVFNDDEPYIDQIGLNSALLSRFDLIEVLTDRSDNLERVMEGRLTDQECSGDNWAPELPFSLAQYINYSFEIRPKISAYQIAQINTRFKTLLSTFKAANILGIRQYEGLLRLTKAKARSRLATSVDAADIEFAFSLLIGSLKRLLRLPENIELNAPNENLVGVPINKLNFSNYVPPKVNRAAESIIQLLSKRALNYNAMFLELANNSKTLTGQDYRRALKLLEDQGMIYKADGIHYTRTTN